jgi:DNA polymerase I-like protein with 3'-5' exonuclease and polymerase domains
VDVTLRLWRLLKPRLVAERRLSVYEVLERGLVEVLGRMELRGIRVDRDILSRLSGDFAQSLARLEYEIHEMAGETFSLGSPKQIGDILFGKMGLPGAKKTPSGQWATPATLLDELAAAGTVLPAKILEWRQLSKLKSPTPTRSRSTCRTGGASTPRSRSPPPPRAGCPPPTRTSRTSRSARKRAARSARRSWRRRARS